MYELVHFWNKFLHIFRVLSDFKKRWDTESPYIHNVSARVFDFSVIVGEAISDKKGKIAHYAHWKK